MGKTGTLSRQLTGWFLVVGLLPWLVVALISYFQSRESLHQAAEQSLGQSADEKIRFINNWFDYRWMDLRLQASSAKNQALLNTLSEALRRSGLPVELFIESSQWQTINKAARSDLRDIRNHYDYIYDLFLIDLNGNILFSEAQQSDLGSNLFTGPLQQSRFAGAVSQSLAQDRAIFSDIERYPPSNNLLCGFLVAPLRDDNGEIQGAFAMQIRLDRLYALLAHEEQDQVYHYLVGTDGLLRSPLAGHEPDVLQKRIATPTFTQWQQIATSSTTQQYVNPLQKGVLGQHNSLTIGNIQWVLISEIDQAAAYSASNWLARFNLMLLVISTVIITTASLYVSKRLTRPITRLSATMEAFARNEPTEPVQVKGKHEIKILADSVNRMMASRERYEGKLRISETATRAALIELSEQQSALSHHAIIAITDVEGTILYVNKKFEEVSGYPSAELVGNNHRILNSGYHPKSFFRNMYKTISSGAVWHAEICNRAKNGQLYWVATTIAPIKNHTGKIERYIAMRTDITQQKAVQQELREARDAAEGAARAKSEFLATMSHEIRTPMNGVLGITQMLMDTPLDNHQRHLITTIKHSGDTLVSIINDILDYSKIEAGKLNIEQIELDLRNLLDECIELFSTAVTQKQIRLLLDVSVDTPCIIISDPTRLRQIIINLLGNAIKFTDQGFVTLSTQYDNTRSELRITVRDTGIGISDEQQRNLFQSFSQADSSTTRKFGGTGLGLAISRSLTQLLGGRINVKSALAEGSEFWLELPCRPLTFPQPNPQLAGKRILVMDPLPEAVISLRHLLEAQGIVVPTSGMGDTPDLIIQHVHQPLQATLPCAVLPLQPMGDNSSKARLSIQDPVTQSQLLQTLQRQFTGLEESSNGSHQSKDFSTLNVLVAEDNQVNQMVVKGLLKKFNIEPDLANDGLEAIRCVTHAAVPYDLILMDCEMPNMDGYQTTSQLRSLSQCERTRIVGLSAHAMQEHREAGMAAGMVAFLTKPLAIETLAEELSRSYQYKTDPLPK